MDSLTLMEAKYKRSHIKASATRLKNYIETFDISKGSRHDIAERKRKLTDLWDQFENIQTRIESLESQDPSNIDEEALLEQQTQQRANFETIYFNLVARYESLLEHFDGSPAPQSTGESSHNHMSMPVSRETRVKLPKIELPVFSGGYEDWYTFHDTFDKLIHSNDNLKDIEKFHYLRSSLKDKASEIIQSIEVTTDNYQEAWTAIRERFDNKRWIIQKHVKAIFEASALSRENPVALCDLVDTIRKHLRALKALNRPTDEWGDLLIHIIIAKLDIATNKTWETSLPDANMPDLKSLLDFLSKRCQVLEAIHNCKYSSSLTSNGSQKSFAKSKGNVSVNIATSDLVCPQCKGNHYLYHCDTFGKLPIEKRLQTVRKAHLCSNCLRSSSHQAKACNSSSCRKCDKKHNTLLHLSDTTNQGKSITSESSDLQNGLASASVVTQCVSNHCSLNILLSTAVVNVYDVNGENHSCRVLLDSGSQMNFITDELTSRLRLKEQLFEASITGIMEGSLSANRLVNLCVKSRFNNFRENIDCLILTKITQYLSHRFVTAQSAVSFPKHMKLADPNFNIPGSIDMLIGAGLFWKLLCVGQIRRAQDQPILQKTHFGWIVFGPLPDNMPLPSIQCHLAVTEDLGHILNRFWEVEHISPSRLTKESLRCEEHFQQYTRRNSDGRFVVRMPLKVEKLDDLTRRRQPCDATWH